MILQHVRPVGRDSTRRLGHERSLCHLAYHAPLLTRRERANKLCRHKKDFLDHYGPEPRTIIGELLHKHADHGTARFTIPDVFEVPPISEHGNLKEIAALFGGSEKLI